MKQLTCDFNVLLVLGILFSAVFAQGMEISCDELIAEEYNDTHCLLTRLPNEKLLEIFSYCLANGPDNVKSLEISIKNFMRISMACKNFNRLLPFEVIGEFCKDYAQADKDTTLQCLMDTINDRTYGAKRLPTLVLICASSDSNLKTCGNPLFYWALIQNDIELVITLFKYHANPDVKTWSTNPVFFYPRERKIAQMFVDKGVNIHETCADKNVLWKTLDEWYPADLLIYYLEQGVDPKKLLPDNSCLLHALGIQLVFCGGEDNFLNKAKLLLNAMPEMINHQDNQNRTPLDVAQQFLESMQLNQCGTPQESEQLIALYKEHGGKTAKEITKASMILLLHNDDYLGDLSVLLRDVRKDIVQYMMHLNK